MSRSHRCQTEPIAFAISVLLCLGTACSQGASRQTQLDLEEAVSSGNAAGVRAALKAGADPSLRVESNIPPLAIAALEGHLEIAKVLVEAGADLDPRCRPQVICRALPHAAELGHAELTRFLLDAGADPDSRGPYGDVPLNYALGQKQLATAWILLEHGADPNLTNQFGMSPFAGACAMGLESFVARALEHGADLESKHKYKEHQSVTPLMVAAAYGHLEVVAMLLEAGADSAAEAMPLATAATLARDAGHERIVALLGSRELE